MSTEQEDLSYLCMWTTSNWQDKLKTSNRIGNFSWKTLIWENQHHFLIMYIWDAPKESLKSVMKLWQTTEICTNPGFLLKPRKNYLSELQGNLMQKSYLLGPTTWRSCKEMRGKYCEIANKTTEQLHSVATPCLDDHHLKEEENGSVGESFTVYSQIVVKCLYLARVGRPDIFMVCEQTHSCGQKTDESLWQTYGAFDLVHSSHKWISAILLCG